MSGWHTYWELLVLKRAICVDHEDTLDGGSAGGSNLCCIHPALSGLLPYKPWVPQICTPRALEILGSYFKNYFYNNVEFAQSSHHDTNLHNSWCCARLGTSPDFKRVYFPVLSSYPFCKVLTAEEWAGFINTTVAEVVVTENYFPTW